MPSFRRSRSIAAGLAGVVLAAASPASAQLLVIESRVPGQPEVSPATYAATAEALDDLKGVKVVKPEAMKAAIATATPSLHLLDAPRLKLLSDKVTAAFALAGGADPARALELAREAHGPLLLATVAGAEAETRAVYFGCMAALAEANRNLGRTADAVAALRDAALYASEYEVTHDAYPAPLVELYHRARSELASAKGLIEVTASDPEAELTIDGISAGKGSFAGELPRGEHYAYARADKASSAMMRFVVTTTRSALRLEVVDPDLVRFGPNPYVEFSNLSDRTLREPAVATTLLRRGGSTGVAFVSFDGTNVEVRVHDASGKLLASGAGRPKGGLEELAKRLHPEIPRTAKAAAAGVAPGPGDGAGPGDKGKRDRIEKPRGAGGATSVKKPLLFGGVAVGAAGFAMAVAGAAGSAGAERAIRDRLAYSGFFDYDLRLSLRSAGRAWNAVAVVGVILFVAGAAGTLVAILPATNKGGSPGTTKITWGILPDGTLGAEF